VWTEDGDGYGANATTNWQSALYFRQKSMLAQLAAPVVTATFPRARARLFTFHATK
jgi:hypothetical protein